MHKWEAVAGCSADDVSLLLKGIIKVCWKRRIELSSFIALFEIKPEVLSTHNDNDNDNASALTTVKTWLYFCMQIQTNIVQRSCLDNREKAGHIIMVLIMLPLLQWPSSTSSRSASLRMVHLKLNCDIYQKQKYKKKILYWDKPFHFFFLLHWIELFVSDWEIQLDLIAWN